MGLFSFILNLSDELSNEKKKNEREKLENKMDYHGLNEHEKELVRKGDYDPWNFEYPENDEELDEDDFYSEDDDYK